jgi:hypothetical protein
MKMRDQRIRNLYKRLKRAKWAGGGLLLLGLVNLLDSYTPFPIPLTGTPAWLTSLALIIVGGIWFYQYFKPREDEIVLLAKQHTDGYLTVVLINELLGIPVRTIAKNLVEMYNEGIIVKVSNPEIKNVYECVFRVPNVAINGPTTPAALPLVSTIEINERFLDDNDQGGGF